MRHIILAIALLLILALLLAALPASFARQFAAPEPAPVPDSLIRQMLLDQQTHDRAMMSRALVAVAAVNAVDEAGQAATTVSANALTAMLVLALIGAPLLFLVLVQRRNPQGG